jgi:hypothetical protein
MHSMSVKCQGEVRTDKEWAVLEQQLDHGSRRSYDTHDWRDTEKRCKPEEEKVRIAKEGRKRQAMGKKRQLQLCHQARKWEEGWAQPQQQAKENETARLHLEEEDEGTRQAERERRARLVGEKEEANKGVGVRPPRRQQAKKGTRRREEVEKEEKEEERQAQLLGQQNKEERTTRLFPQQYEDQRVLHRREDRNDSKAGGSPCLGVALCVVLGLPIWGCFPRASRLPLSPITDVKWGIFSVLKEKMAPWVTHWSTTEGDFVTWTLLQWVWWCYWWSFVWCFGIVFLGSPFLGFVMKKYVFGPRAERVAREKAAKEAARRQEGRSPTT